MRPARYPGVLRATGLRRFIKVFAIVGMVLGAGVIAGLFVARRLRTGEWAMPDGDDLVHVKRRMMGPTDPPRKIVLYRGPIAIKSGEEDANKSESSIIKSRAEPYALPGFRGSDKTWKAIVTCVKQQFARYDVEISETRPASSENHILVAVGGKPGDIGLTSKSIGGLAPFNTEVVPNAVVFAFSAALGNRVRPTCETIAMEVAHAYGLDHEYLCKDPMTYRSGCGNKSFQDTEARCGEKKPRDCADGKPTQNSHARLLSVLGPSRQTVAITPPSR